MSHRQQIHIYLRDEATFKKLQGELKTLWYERYGESLSGSELFMVAYEYLRDGLTGRGDSKPNDIKGQDIYKYCRTGIQS